MSASLPHRKRIEHIEEPGHAHELTFSCYQRRPLLLNERWLCMLAESVERATDRHDYRLISFVYMPEHVHLLVFPNPEASSIAALLKAIKRPFFYRIKELLIDSNNRLLDQLTIRQRPGVTTFRFWQEGPGYDRNFTEPKTAMQVIDYIHRNPTRRGLCEKAVDWRWSSAHRFLQPESPVDPALPNLQPLPPEFLLPNQYHQ